METDQQLLRQYASARSEAAFNELVRRHLNVVFSTALRVGNGDSHFAEDIAQTVFAHLARKAGEAAQTRVLSGWLYRHTWFTAVKAIRRERRRLAREQEAMKELSRDPVGKGTAIPPENLDEALNSLAEEDRDLLIMRFFEKRDLKSVGAAYGISDDAAQKRVSRALEKLRGIMFKAAPLGVTALAAMLEEQIISAPAGLSWAVSRTALASTLSGSGLLQFARQLMGPTGLKASAAAIALVLLAAPALIQNRALSRLTRENDALRTNLAELDRLREQNSELQRWREEDAALAQSTRAELLQLRAEVTRLHRLSGLNAARAAQISEQGQPKEQTPNATSDALPQVTITTQIAYIPAELFGDFARKYGYPSSFTPIQQVSRNFDSQSLPELMKELQTKPGVDLLTAPRITTLSGREAKVNVTDSVTLGNDNFEIGPVFDLLPTVQKVGDRYVLSLSFVASFTQVLQNDLPSDLGRLAGEPNEKWAQVRTRILNGETSMTDGFTYGLAAPYWNEAKKNVVLLLLLTPYLIDPVGNRISAN
ncbi:MAG TPA: sigma-70 family RNA polymerase sigma factor [Verrucomicrobiae bacterium]|nr:sigma-70 family RNA polymerase sigma factor [Verrucomicrobiae bacterium]